MYISIVREYRKKNPLKRDQALNDATGGQLEKNLRLSLNLTQ